MRKLALLTIFAFFFASALAQPKIDIFTDNKTVSFSQPFVLHIKITNPEPAPFVLQKNKEELIPGFPIYGISVDTIGKKPFVIDFKITLLPLEQDTIVTIPPQAIFARQDTFYTDSLKIKVLPFTVDKQLLSDLENSLQADSEIFAKTDTPQNFNSFWKQNRAKYQNNPNPPVFDIKDILKPPCTFKEFFKRHGLALLILLLVALMAAIIWLLYKKRKVKNGKELDTSLPPHIWAKQELEKLLNKQLYQKGELKEFYFALSHIIKRYLEMRFNLDILDRTTYETVSYLKASKIVDNQTVDKVKSILSIADLVKFAKYKPDEFINKQSINFAFEIIEDTKPETEETVAEDTAEQKNQEQ